MILVVVTVVWGGGFIATDGALDALSPFYIMMNRDRDISVSGVCLSNLWLEVFNAE